MRSRDEVLRAFGTAQCVKGDNCADFDCVALNRMADRIRELEAQLVSNPYTLAASEPVACRCGKCSNLCLVDVDLSDKAHPSAAGVTVTEAMVDAFMAAYAKCEQDNEWIFTHRMGVREAMCAALTAALTRPTTPTRGRDE